MTDERAMLADGWVCSGCGSAQSLAEIRERHPQARACCPERKLAPPEGCVRVPRELLRRVLEDAWDDSYTAQYDTERNRGDGHAHVLDRARIAELRKAAGLDNELEPSTGWRWWSRDEPEDGLLGFETVEDRDAFSRGDEGPFRRVISDDGRTIRQGETWREMMDRMSNAAGLNDD